MTTTTATLTDTTMRVCQFCYYDVEAVNDYGRARLHNHGWRHPLGDGGVEAWALDALVGMNVVGAVETDARPVKAECTICHETMVTTEYVFTTA